MTPTRRPRRVTASPGTRGGAPTRHELGRDGDHCFVSRGRPVGNRLVASLLELGRVADLGGHAGHGDAPTRVIDRIEVVDLEGDDNVLQRGIELAAPTGAHQDALAVEVKADGQHRRQRA